MGRPSLEPEKRHRLKQVRFCRIENLVHKLLDEIEDPKAREVIQREYERELKLVTHPTLKKQPQQNEVVQMTL
ncbi:hypothetical protein [Paenibacillus sp. MMO-58]|uniref:hypothetical protein n=1 Tax=Paenibacillus sp. MMO-58 TaxID=3081290 RepID=UPI0030162590